MLQFKTKLIAAMVLLIVFTVAMWDIAIASDGLACDFAADVALGIEDYPTTISLHQRLLRMEPDNAMAHYHLGFAYGMIHQPAAEMREYLLAAALGLRRWDLFLNLGMVQLERAQVYSAVVTLKKAVILAPDHVETHLSLGIAYERAGLLSEAAEQLDLSLKIDPGQIDAQNELAAVDAEIRNYQQARQLWANLVKVHHDFEPASRNVLILQRHE